MAVSSSHRYHDDADADAIVPLSSTLPANFLVAAVEDKSANEREKDETACETAIKERQKCSAVLKWKEYVDMVVVAVIKLNKITTN